MLPNGSSAVTLKLNAVPAVALVGALMTKCEAAAALTLMLALVPVTDVKTVSVAVIVRVPAKVRVAMKLPTPFVNVLIVGKLVCAFVSVLVNATVPA